MISGKMISTNDSYVLLYTIVIPLLLLGIVLFVIFFCSRHRRQNNNNHRHSPCTDTLKSSIKPRQPLIHHNDVMFPSTKSHTSNDYLADSVDSIPVHRQYQQQRYGPSNASDLASLTSSNPYYTRVQAL